MGVPFEGKPVGLCGEDSQGVVSRRDTASCQSYRKWRQTEAHFQSEASAALRIAETPIPIEAPIVSRPASERMLQRTTVAGDAPIRESPVVENYLTVWYIRVG